MAETIEVEVAFALPEKQVLISLEVAPGSTVADVLSQCGIAERFPNMPFDTLDVGIWGHIVDRQSRVNPGDRVEIYRPLLLDPRDARRELARAGLTMRASKDD